MAADGSVSIAITADDAEAQAKLADLRKEINRTTNALNKSQDKKSDIQRKLESARKEAQETANEIERVSSLLDDNKRKRDVEIPRRISGIASMSPEEYSALNADIYAQTQEKERLLAIQEKQNASVADLEQKEKDVLSTIQEQTASLANQKEEAGAVERVLAEQSTSTMPQIKAAIDQVNTSLKKGFKNILKWGFGIRSAFILIRRLRSALKEGINTFANYDEETRNNIDRLKGSLGSLKMAWGAAFAPILNAVAPILQRLINLLITAANYVQMFFAVLRGGSSYKQIIANNNALAKSYGGAGGAAKDAKKEVLAFDELNKLNDNNSGGGGGGGSDGIEPPKDTLIPPETLEKLQWVRDHLKEILTIAGAIGTVLLAWKIASGLGANVGGLLGTFKQVLGIITAIAGAVVLVKNFLDAWNNGINFDNFIGMLEGILLLVVGLGLAFGTTGAAIGILVGGVALLVIGLKEFIETGTLTDNAFLALEAGITAVGVALALLTGSWIPLLVAAVVMIALVVIKYWDNIKAALKQAWDWIKNWWIENVVKKFKQGAEDLRGDWERMKDAASRLKEWLISTFTAMKERVLNAFSTLKEGIVTKFQEAKDKVTEIGQRIKDFFANLNIQLPHIALPHIQVSWTDTSQSSIAKLLGITAIPNFSLAWYAKGGIVDGATLIGAGEAGKEAIVPLERNTEWIHMVANGIIDGLTGNNKLADYISSSVVPAVMRGQIVPPRALSGGGSMFTDGDIQRLVNGITAAFSGNEEQSIKLYLDGREIAQTVTRHQRRMERGFA